MSRVSSTHLSEDLIDDIRVSREKIHDTESVRSIIRNMMINGAQDLTGQSVSVRRNSKEHA